MNDKRVIQGYCKTFSATKWHGGMLLALALVALCAVAIAACTPTESRRALLPSC